MTQNEALAILESGQSVLLTGAAGSGKTYLLRKFIKRARADGKSLAVTATTGLAATHLNGVTIHSWSGIGVREFLDGVFYNKLSRQRSDLITKADVLIIDEISMLHDFRLDLVEEVTRNIRGGSRPFGGMQVILCGDFFQLPPVNRSDAKQGGFVTSSQAWLSDVFEVCYLEEQHRQSSDRTYSEILNGIRAGQLTRSQLEKLQQRSEAVMDPFMPRTRLLTTNVDVDAVNQVHLDQIDGEETKYEAQTTGGKKYVNQLKKSCLAPETLCLKTGAVVMCIKNSQDKKFVNGSLGKVIGFEGGTDYPIVELTNGNEITIKPESWELIDGDKQRAMLTQIPLRLAWAITVHKSQGMTLDSAQIDLSKAFVEGMGYVALSRVRGLKDLTLDGMNGMALRTNPIARELDKELRRRSKLTQDKNEATISQWQERESNRVSSSVHDTQNRKPKISWEDKLIKMRKDHPNAYKPWTETEDEKLIKLFGAENTVDKISRLMGRHPGSIKSRLKKLFGEQFIDL